MSDDDRVRACARDNADWCAAVFRSHGLSSVVRDRLWLSKDKAPAYYPNAVTLSPARPGAQRDAVRELRDVLARPFAIKDSFARLDLAADGFRVSFDAEWIWRDADGSPPAGDPEIVWRRVGSAAELGRWEDAWREDGSPLGRQLFVPALLVTSIAVLAATRPDDERIVAGCIAHRSTRVVGLSNFFAVAGDRDRLRAGAVAATARCAAGCAVVGYESGGELDAALRLGFRPVGPLRVWTAEPRRAAPGRAARA